MAFESVNPSTGLAIRRYDETPEAELGDIVRLADAAQRRWRQTSFAERGTVLRRVAQALRDRVEPYAALMAQEMGKPLSQGRAEVEKCAGTAWYFAEHAERFLTSEPTSTDASVSRVAFRPLGVVLAIMPWNFPFWQVIRFAAPALMAGNGAILKHAPNVPGCALALDDLFRAAGLPDGLFRTVLVDAPGAGALIAAPEIKAVTLTGSPRAGRDVAAKAGAALKKTVLELGGSDPYVVLADADLPTTVETCVSSRLLNSGQSCIAAKRFIVVEPVLREFTERFVDLMKSKRVGDPLDRGTDVGPLARRDLRENLHRQVVESVSRGAKLSLGGAVPQGPGWYYPPTVLTDVQPGMPAFDEETFGPVAAIVRAGDEEDAIRLANGTAYGLGAAVFTRDLAKGESLATDRLEAGSCFVNTLVRSDPRLPFGGVKESGYGRELSSFGIREFVNVKTVYVR